MKLDRRRLAFCCVLLCNRHTVQSLYCQCSCDNLSYMILKVSLGEKTSPSCKRMQLIVTNQFHPSKHWKITRLSRRLRELSLGFPRPLRRELLYSVKNSAESETKRLCREREKVNMCCLVLPSDRCCVRFEICCPTLLNNPGGWTKLWLMNLTVDFSSTNQPTSQPPPTDMHTSSWPYPSSHVLPPSGVLGNSGKWLEMAAERKSERRTADPTNHQQHGASERRKKKSFSHQRSLASDS